MQSAWIDRDAEAAVARYADLGRDLALRVYTTRLLGQDPRLVLHGGGNTSVKTRFADLNGDTVDVLCVKGSGWDMGSIEPAGLPAVRLAPLLKLRARETLSDEEMVRLQRANLIDPAAPNPSVEALLHAFIPHKYVDHTHSTAVLALTDQPDGEALCREVYGARVGYVPYLMPGFGLAKAAAQVFDADPSVEGLILVKHGIFSFGGDARQAYERMIELVTLAEQRLAKSRKPALSNAGLPARPAKIADVAPIVRGACSMPDSKADGAWKRFILDFRGSDVVMSFVNGAEVARYGQAGVVTPDHNIRIKNRPLVVAAPGMETSPDSRTRSAVRSRPMASATGLISLTTTRASAASRPCSIRCRAWCWCPVSACSGSAGARRTQKSPAILPRLRSPPSGMPRRSAASSRCRSPICSMSNIGRWSRPNSATPRNCRWRGRSPSSPALRVRSDQRPPKRSRRPVPKWHCWMSTRLP
jgi:rhamnose utilization protein RhaD (predicted bifunctional aldolase and dehydrogenase)